MVETLLKPAEAAARLGVTPRTVQRMIAAGTLQAVHYSARTVRVPESALLIPTLPEPKPAPEPEPPAAEARVSPRSAPAPAPAKKPSNPAPQRSRKERLGLA